MTNFDQLFIDFSKLKVVIIGDVMLDTYWWGQVDRISPEAPVPVVALQRKEHRVGGAANVALNTVALGAQTTIVSVIGTDADGALLQSLFEAQNIDTQYLLSTPSRITTNKTRVMSRNQQMMRLDAEITTPIASDIEKALLQKFTDCLNTQKPDIVIFEDYDKGVLTPAIIKEAIAICTERNIVMSVDPKKNNFLAYKGVTLFKPNLKEVKEGLQVPIPSVTLDNLRLVHTALQTHLAHQISLITLSEKGMFFDTGDVAKIIPTHIRSIADVSGAGDTVIAVASLVYAATKNIELATEMANIAGGLVCEEVGTAAINKSRLLAECKLLLVS
ncbi:MAG: carbohydrate kinase [Bacteroidetes bacterium]|nr:carbohydrate kinase [Bacteroidota bacterium]